MEEKVAHPARRRRLRMEFVTNDPAGELLVTEKETGQATALEKRSLLLNRKGGRVGCSIEPPRWKNKVEGEILKKGAERQGLQIDLVSRRAVKRGLGGAVCKAGQRGRRWNMRRRFQGGVEY